MKPMRERGVIILSILLLVLAACGGGATEETSEPVEEEVVVETLDSPAVTTESAINTGTGVTEEPCPECSSTEVKHVFGKSHIGDPWHHAGRRIDEGFRDRLREIKKLNPRNTIDIR